ncbi:THAP domain-containing protein 6 isoform X3 [Vicugna pacos]|uniref:THAP domain-containing protein 6 isoform X3 n=1 Tax=Vicugna pacos TaxID=30538 RepID=A0ABM5BMI8_VICPA
MENRKRYSYWPPDLKRTSADLQNSELCRFPTDEKVKRKWVLAMKRLDVNAAGIWEPKKGDVLCSRHFKKTDFDRSAPNIKLKPGVIPSIFDSPSHLQGKKEKLHCRKNFTLKTLPVTNHNHQLVGASSESARLDDPSGRPDSTTVWTCYGPLSCFWPHAELAAFMSPVYRSMREEDKNRKGTRQDGKTHLMGCIAAQATVARRATCALNKPSLSVASQKQARNTVPLKEGILLHHIFLCQP